ncbi:TetR/AcrR family transcriptional regulator [Streptomyces sp. NPDC002088]|uniref:TetR/AcrR family transcriptional regulator n=1 Tax=Streptomyces sp. NPDC002088 TaxID=3154665 RepID=UPI00332BE942
METTTRRTRGVQTGPRSRQVISSVRAATLAELERVGFTAMTVDAVARAAGVNRTTIYRRWPSKTALLATVVEPLLQRYDDIPETGDACKDLVAVMRMICEAWTSPEGQALRVAAGAAHHELQSLVDQVTERSLAPLRRVLGHAARRGDIREDDVTMIAHLAFHGVATWQRSPSAPLTDDDCRRMAHILLGAAGGDTPPS